MADLIRIGKKSFPVDERFSTLMDVMSAWNPIYVGMSEGQKQYNGQDVDRGAIMLSALSAVKKMKCRTRYGEIRDALMSGNIPRVFYFWLARRMMDVSRFKKPTIRWMEKNITTEEYNSLVLWIGEYIFRIDNGEKKKTSEGTAAEYIVN